MDVYRQLFTYASAAGGLSFQIQWINGKCLTVLHINGISGDIILPNRTERLELVVTEHGVTISDGGASDHD